MLGYLLRSDTRKMANKGGRRHYYYHCQKDYHVHGGENNYLHDHVLLHDKELLLSKTLKKPI